MTLYLSEVRFDQRQLAELLKESYSSGMVHARNEYYQKVVEHHGLVVQIELDSLVVQLNVGNLEDKPKHIAFPKF